MSSAKTPIEKMEELKLKFDALRVRHPKAFGARQHSDDVMLTWTSNAIEGNTLTLGETAMVIEKGITVGGKSLTDHLAVEDHYKALQIVRRLATDKMPLDESTVTDLHRAVLLRSRVKEAGHYADVPRRIAGSNVVLPAPHKIPSLMAEFGKKLTSASGALAAFEAHYQLVTIHPFVDGNGRTARLLMNLILIRDGYTPVTIGNKERLEYINTIERRQLKEPLGHNIIDKPSRDQYINFLVNREIYSLRDYIRFVADLKKIDQGRSAINRETTDKTCPASPF